MRQAVHKFAGHRAAIIVNLVEEVHARRIAPKHEDAVIVRGALWGRLDFRKTDFRAWLHLCRFCVKVGSWGIAKTAILGDLIQIRPKGSPEELGKETVFFV